MPLSQGLTFAQLFDLSPNASALLDRELRVVGANTAYLALTGLTWSAIQDAHFFDVLAMPEADRTRASIEQVFATGQRDDKAFVRYGNDRVVSMATSAVKDEQGRVAWVLHQVADLSGMRSGAVEQLGLGILGRASRSEAELEMLQQAFEQSPGFAALLRGPEHRIAIANPAYLELIGRETTVVGQTVASVMPEVVAQGFIKTLDEVYETKKPFVGRGVHVELKRAGGVEQRIVDFVYQPVHEGDVTFGIFVLGQDITDARRIEHDRSRLQAEQRELIELAPQQVWTATADGKLDYVNLQTVAYFEKSAEAIVGDGWQAVVHPDDLPATIDAWIHSLTTGTLYQREFRLRRADGEYRWHLARATAVRGKDGAIFSWIGTNTDIHDARVAHDDLRTRAAYEEKLIGIVSHDLRNPLATIVLSLSLLEGAGINATGERALGHIKTATAQAEHLISDLMDFSQARTGTFPIAPTPTNLVSLIKPAVDAAVIVAGQRDVAVEHHGPQIGSWDEGRLIQVLANLIGNAFQHAPPGAAIRVTSRIEGDRTTIDIFNEGEPITPADRSRLFDPFARGTNARTRRGRSIGLGLYIAQQITRAHGGEITVTSEAGIGTTFRVSLPTRPPA